MNKVTNNTKDIPVTKGWKIKKGDKAKLDNDLPSRIFTAIEIGKYVVRLVRKETSNDRNEIYELHFKRSKYFKIQR